jgi:beta-mannosidase
VDNIHVITHLNDALDVAELSITVNLAGNIDSTNVEIIIEDDLGKIVFSENASIQGTCAVVNTRLFQPKLWWPNGHGDHPVYTAKAHLNSKSNTILDSSTTKFGIRRIELIQRRLDNEPGNTFMFQVNNHPIFAQGGNWIPADMMLPTIPRQRYFDWMELAAHSNLNMIRVWGGGIYESEDFFDACDENGLLVWHDFAFACGHFPVRKEFLKSVELEAVAQTKRMRNRACLALLCGGNEDFMLQDMYRPGSYDHHDTTGPFLGEPFEWREIYLGVLPRVVKDVAPRVEYWPSSPWGGDTANDKTVGDVHQWDGKSPVTSSQLSIDQYRGNSLAWPPTPLSRLSLPFQPLHLRIWYARVPFHAYSERLPQHPLRRTSPVRRHRLPQQRSRSTQSHRQIPRREFQVQYQARRFCVRFSAHAI